MENIFSPNYILSVKSISIDNPTTYSSVLFTKDHIYVAPRLTLNDSKPIQINGMTSFQHFEKLVNEITDPAALHIEARNIANNFEGHHFDVTQLKNLVVKNGWFSRGVYMRENIDTFKKFNRAITGGGKELYVKLGDFYKDFKPMKW
jgi:hypothetical protein